MMDEARQLSKNMVSLLSNFLSKSVLLAINLIHKSSSFLMSNQVYNYLVEKFSN